MSRGRKFRGRRTHGHGKKAPRGAGLRGGRGRAGSHKHRYMSAIKAGRRFGNRGFKSIQRAEKVTINVGELGSLVGEGKVVDLTSLGIDKLLGAGSLAEEVKGKEIRVKSASAKAIEKVKSAELVLEGEKEMESG